MKLRRRLSLWVGRFRRGPVHGLSGHDLCRIIKGSLRPLKRLPPDAWSDAIMEVPIPRRGFDMNLDVDALCALARRRTYV